MVVGNNPAMQLEQQRALVSDGRVLTAVRMLPLRRLVKARRPSAKTPCWASPSKESRRGSAGNLNRSTRTAKC